MSEALQQVERLRREAVQQARAALAEAQRAQQGQAELRTLRRRELAVHEQALRAARAGFVQAASVAALRCATVHIEQLQATVARAAERLLRAGAAYAQAAARVQRCEQELLAREVQRQVVARALEKRAHEVSVRTERQLEDAAEDAFRARARS